MKIETGREYGYRKQRYAVGKPLCPVIVLKLGPSQSNKVRIRWLEGEYEGLEEWIRRDTLLCTWDVAGEYIADEVRLAQAVQASERTYKTIEWQAIREVFWSFETELDLADKARHDGLLIIKDFPGDIANIGLDPSQLLDEPLAFVDRFNSYIAPFSTAQRIARQLCKAHPERIISILKEDICAYERAARTGWYVPSSGGRPWDMSVEHAQQRLEETQTILDVVSEWCGTEYIEKFDLIVNLREEVTVLRQILADTLQWMLGTAEEQKAPWLKAKYIDVYRNLTGENPPKAKPRSQSAKRQ